MSIILDFSDFWILDWERKHTTLLATHALPVAVGTIMGKRPMEAAYKWFDDNIGGVRTYSTEVGVIEIDKESIQDSLAHKFSQAKLDAVSSLFDGFRNATYITSTVDIDGKPIVNHFFTYPIDYAGCTTYVLCRTREDVNKNRLYIHEVFPAHNIRSATIQTLAGQSQPQRGRALYEKLLAAVIYGKGTNKT